MKILRKGFDCNVYLKMACIFSLAVFMLIGCASSPAGFKGDATGPQLMVEPDTIRLGIAKLSGTQILFKGKRFEPGDSVFVNLVGVKKGGESADIPVADAEVDKDGSFIAEVGILPKMNEILRAKLGSNEKMETVIIVTQPPIPEGVYTARAVSMVSDKTAETLLTVKGPSILDRIKDWIGILLGKIKKQ
jgi:hypothetical protein